MKKFTLFLLTLVCTLTGWAQMIADGQYITIKSSQTSEYIAADANVNTLVTSSALNEKCYWFLEKAEGTDTSVMYYLYNPDTQLYMGQGPAAETNFPITNDKNNAGRFTINGTNTDFTLKVTPAGTYAYLHCATNNHNPHDIVVWNASASDTYSKWTITNVNEDEACATYINGVKTAAANMQTQIGALPTGALTGNAAIDDNPTAFQNAVDALNADGGATKANADAVNEYLNCGDITPLNGYYRIISYDKNNCVAYTYSTIKNMDILGVNEAAGSNAPTTIFKFIPNSDDNDGTYYMQNQGKYIENICVKSDWGWTSLVDDKDNAAHVALSLRSLGVFKMQDQVVSPSNQLTNNNHLYDNRLDYHYFYQTDQHITGWQYADNTKDACSWYLVPATSIEVAVNSLEGDSEYKYASGYFPFGVKPAGELPANLYVGEADYDNQRIKVKKAENGVAANNGMIIESPFGASVAILNIDDEAATGSTAIVGTNVQLNFSSDSPNTDYLVLGPGSSNVIGFYRYNVDTREIPANRAYVKAHANGGAMAVDFNGSTPTAIESILENKTNDAAPIYDLSGRRVMKATHGLYIQGGKKFYVK